MKWLRRELGFLGGLSLRGSEDARLGAQNSQTSGACGLFLNGSLAVFLLCFEDKGGEGDPVEWEPWCWPPSSQPGRRKPRPRSVPPPKQIEMGR